MSYDFAGLNQRLLADFPSLMQEWLPGGKMVGHEYFTSGLGGGGGGSMAVNANTGRWGDFAHADGEVAGGDLISLYAAIKQIDNGEAYRDLGGDIKPNGHASRSKEPEQPVEVHTPPGDDFQPSIFNHYKHGPPSKFWVYRDVGGTPIMVVARYETKSGKEISPWVYNGLRWVNKSHPPLRPLYGLERLSQFNNPVLLVEGEKTADAAQHYFPTRPCLTWCGGCGQATTADWTPLAGRAVTIWPDNDESGKKAALKIAGKLVQLGCSVTVIDPLEFDDGWDLADGLQAGMPKAQLVTYAKSHSREVSPLKMPEPKQPKKAAAEYQQKPINGSMYETWQRFGFSLRSNGRPYSNYMNVGAAITARGDLDIYYEQFSQRVMIGDHPFTDEEAGEIAVWLQANMGMPEISVDTVFRGVVIYAKNRQRNKLTDWLHSLEWDGESRLAQLMPRGFGARDIEYTREVGRCFIMSLVARAIQPGCKADCMPVFEGPQGIFKSSALAIIGGEWFIEIHENINSKDFYLSLSGRLLGEISEMQTFSQADIRKVKGIISTLTDSYRKPYDKATADHKRTCVFAGTTNTDDWNTDETGARRFWPIRCGVIDKAWIKVNRDQLFAEALHLYESGGHWYDVPHDAAEEQREARRQIHPWEGFIMRFCAPRLAVSTDQIIQSCIELDKQVTLQTHAKLIGQIMKANKWVNKIKRVNGKQHRLWHRPSGTLPENPVENPDYDYPD